MLEILQNHNSHLKMYIVEAKFLKKDLRLNSESLNSVNDTRMLF